MIRLKTFLHLSTLRKYTEPKTQDNNNKTILKSYACLANWGWPQSTAAHLHASCWAACACSAHNTSDTSQEGTELFTGNHLLQGPASPPPDPSSIPLPPYLSSEAYLVPRRLAKKLIQVGIWNHRFSDTVAGANRATINFRTKFQGVLILFVQGLMSSLGCEH